MKQTGIVRPIDKLGRIVLPIEIRRQLGLKDGNMAEIFLDGDCIVLRKFKYEGCQICGSVFETAEIEGTKICKQCLHKMLKQVQNDDKDKSN